MNELFPTEVLLIERVGPVASPDLNIVYSTSPVAARDASGREYITKGEDDRRIVLAETVAYSLAGELGIPVPEFAVGRFGVAGALVFCSEVVNGIRDVIPFLRSLGDTHKTALSRMILLDIWLANPDRNSGNILGRSGTDVVELVAIDFEKAIAIRSSAPIVETATVDPKLLWPTDKLGEILRGQLPAPNQSMISDFTNIQDSRIQQVVRSSISVLGMKDDGFEESVVHCLVSRKRQLEILAGEAWQ